MATQASTGQRGEDGECGPERRERPARGELEAVAEVREHCARPVADRVRHVARPAERRVEPDERDAGDDDARRPRATTRRASTRVPSTRRASVAYAASRTSRPPPSAPNRLPATATSASARDGDPEASEQGRAEQRGEEQERLEQVRDAVEAPRLGRPERRERDGLRVEAERRGDTRRGSRRRRARAAAPPRPGRRARRPTSRRARGSRRARARITRGARRGAKSGRDVGDRTDEDAQRQPDPVVALDPLLRAARGHRRGRPTGDHLEPPARDVGEGDEPVDPRRVGGEEPARPRRRPRSGSDRSRSGRAAGGRRACRAAGLRRARCSGSDGRSAAEQRALHLAGQQRVERAFARDGRAGAGNGEPDRARGRRSARAGTGRRRRPQPLAGAASASAARIAARARGTAGVLPTGPARVACEVMIVERSMDERWLSNAFLVGDEPGGVAVFVDSGAPLEPLLETLERERLAPTHILRTHGHPDHVEHEELLDPAVRDPGRDRTRSRRAASGSRRSRPRATRTTESRSSSTTSSASRATRSSAPPSGGGPAEVVRDSVMEKLMSLDHGRARAPGAHGRDDDRPRVGAEPVRALLARARRGGRRALPRRRARTARCS